MLQDNSITVPILGQEPSLSTLVDAGGFSAASDTPASNTGCQNTCFGLDWLSFTLRVDERVGIEDQLAFVYGTFGEGVPVEHGASWYSHMAIICEKGRVLWSPDHPRMGVHVDLPASALGWYLANRWTWPDLAAFLLHLFHAGVQFTRVDWAMDDCSGQLDIEEIDRYTVNGWVTTRWRRGHRYDGRLEDVGHTLEFGRRSSESFLRIYDKTAERLDKGAPSASRGPALPVRTSPAGDAEPAEGARRVRCELQLRKDVAHASVLQFLCEGSAGVVGALRGLIEFKEPGVDTNVSRWAPAAWWLAFLGGVEKGRFIVGKVEQTVERVARWLEKQVAPSLAFLALYLGDGLDTVTRLLEVGSSRLKPWHVAVLQGG